MCEVKKNTYKVVWENSINGNTLTSAEIDVPVAGDVVIEHINVLSQFHSIFHPPPPPVKRIEELTRRVLKPVIPPERKE